jgi:hypothetical protein
MFSGRGTISHTFESRVSFAGIDITRSVLKITSSFLLSCFCLLLLLAFVEEFPFVSVEENRKKWPRGCDVI